MIYYTGDIHGDASRIIYFARRMELTENDVIVILGDVCANYFRGIEDIFIKLSLSRVKPTVFCIHGNHECRPANISSYKTKRWNGGTVWYEPQFPSLLFAKDGEIYDIEGITHLAIGGAYSVDKEKLIKQGYGWWPDEQPSERTKRRVERQITGRHIDVILSHTCPFKYRPVEAFLPWVNQASVDNSTEKWLDEIEAVSDYDAWLCGHWHINKRIDKLRFLFEDFISAEMLKK